MICCYSPSYSDRGLCKLADPMQRAVQPPALLQTANLADANIASLLHVRCSQAGRAICLVELPSALARRPLRSERRNQTVDFVEVDTIATQIRTAARSVLDPAAGNDFGHNLGKFANTKVLVVASHVECLVMYRLARSIEYGHNRGDDVAYMNDWPPGRTVALDQISIRGECRGNQVVQHNVEAQS